MAKVYVVYEDWRDRRFAPAIVDVCESEFMASEANERRRNELVAEGYEDDEEFRIMTECREVTCSESKERIMSREEKIQLHELLGKYVDEASAEIEQQEAPGQKTKEEVLALITMKNHVKVMDEVRGILVLDF